MGTHILRTHGGMALNIFQLFVGVCMCSTEACCSLSHIYLVLNIKVLRLYTVHLVHFCIDTDTKCT